MTEAPSNAILEKIYVEGGQWIRMVNTTLWSMGGFLVTLSGGCIGLGLKTPSQMPFFAACSIFAFSFWVYVSLLYRSSAADTRRVLMQIEAAWELPAAVALYRAHGQVVSLGSQCGVNL